MPKILVGYDSETGNTKTMAEEIAKGARQVNGVNVEVKHVNDIQPEKLLDFDGIIIGSPTYFGVMSAPVKTFFDKSIAVYKKLDGKVGAAFTSSGGLACGAETTIRSIIDAMLIHGMIIQGDTGPNHYGAAAQKNPSEKDKETCRRKGERVAKLVMKLFGDRK
ncbi:MAG: flavodoxin family protein [Candidatus Ranarchaeia archaeon]